MSTIHEAIVSILLERHPGARRHGFGRAFWAAVSPDIDDEIDRSALPQLRPDAYEFRYGTETYRGDQVETATAVLYEVEDTSRLSPDKLCRLARLASVAEAAGWTLEVVIVDRYGRETPTPCGPIYEALVEGGYPGPVEPAMVRAIF